jgi:hypothetical protein
MSSTLDGLVDLAAQRDMREHFAASCPVELSIVSRHHTRDAIQREAAVLADLSERPDVLALLRVMKARPTLAWSCWTGLDRRSGRNELVLGWCFRLPVECCFAFRFGLEDPGDLDVLRTAADTGGILLAQAPFVRETCVFWALPVESEAIRRYLALETDQAPAEPTGA